MKEEMDMAESAEKTTRIGIIGVGQIGKIHLGNYQKTTMPT